jgi:hypothetical protein
MEELRARQAQAQRDAALRALELASRPKPQGRAPLVETVMRDGKPVRVAFSPDDLREVGMLGEAPLPASLQRPTPKIEERKDGGGVAIYEDGAFKTWKVRPPQEREQAPANAQVVGTDAQGRVVFFDPKQRTTGIADVPQGTFLKGDPLIAEDAKNREKVRARQTMLDRLDAYEAVLAEVEKTGYTAETIAALQNVVTAAQMEAKNYAELGALSGPDMGLVNSTLTDPVSARGVLIGNAGRRRQIELMRQQMRGDITRIEQSSARNPSGVQRPLTMRERAEAKGLLPPKGGN